MAVVLKKRALAEYGSLTEVKLPARNRLKISIFKQVSSDSVSDTSYFSLLQHCKSSNDAYLLLINMPELINIKYDELSAIIKVLSDQFNQRDSNVRSKIFSVFCTIGQLPNIDAESIIDQVLDLITSEISHKVISNGLLTLLTLSKTLSSSNVTCVKVLEVAKFFLHDTNHHVKNLCLQLIAILNGPENLMLIASYMFSDDARVRCKSLETLEVLHKKGIQIDASLYNDVSHVLNDDYEIVRVAALRIVCLIGSTYPDNNIQKNNENLRLIDDAFIKICGSVTDSSMVVRNAALQLLGTFLHVNIKFINQTLDKKLMSNMRKKISFHERSTKLVTSGEWISGKKWAADDAQWLLNDSEICIMPDEACGAFVHGLEDDSVEIRISSVSSMCSLALAHPNFATRSLDFLVDMLSDDINEVRTKAIESLISMAHLIIIREHQLETILGVLEDSSVFVREGIHRLISSSNFSSKECLQICLKSLVRNLRKYSLDKKMTWNTAKEIGKTQSELLLHLIPMLLGIHPFFDLPEPNIDDPCYIMILICVFNAATSCLTIASLFEEKTIKHYGYLRMTMPSFVPHLVLSESIDFFEPVNSNTSLSLLSTLIDCIPNTPSEISQTIISQLNALAKIDSFIAGPAKFAVTFVSCQILITKFLKNKLWYSNSLTEMQRKEKINNLLLVILKCLELQYLFSGLEKEILISVKQIQLISIAIYFIFIVKTTKLISIALLENIINDLKAIEQFFEGMKPDQTSLEILEAMKNIENIVPNEVTKCLFPLLENVKITKLPNLNTNIHICYAQLNLPTTSPDTPLKFTAGLILAVQLDAYLYCLGDPQTLRVRIRYPNDTIGISKPPDTDFQKVNSENSGGDYQLLTKAFVFSESSWSESCYVEISLCIDISGGASNNRFYYGLDPYLDLCEPLKLYIRTKPITKTAQISLS